MAKKPDIRPLNPGEFVQNKDGTRSTERSMSVRHPDLNGGAPTNIPSMYVKNGKVFEASSEDEAVSAALATRRKFQAFKTMDEAVAEARARSSRGGAFQGSMGK